METKTPLKLKLKLGGSTIESSTEDSITGDNMAERDSAGANDDYDDCDDNQVGFIDLVYCYRVEMKGSGKYFVFEITNSFSFHWENFNTGCTNLTNTLW